MRVRSVTLLFLLLVSVAFGQKEKTAQYYYDKAMATKNSPTISFGQKYFLALPDFFKAAQMAEEASMLQLNAIYNSAYFYNYAHDSLKPTIAKLIMNGVKHVKKLDDNRFKADYLFRTGLAYERDYKPDTAIYFFEYALKIYEDLDGPRSVDVSDCYHCIGDVHKTAFSDFKTAEKYYELALPIREQAKEDITNSYLVSKMYSELASLNKVQFDYDKALAYSLKFVAFAEGLLMTFYYPIKEEAYNNAADIYVQMKRFDEAMELYDKGIAINKKFNKNPNNKQLGLDYSGKADVYFNTNDFVRAADYYSKALSIFLKVEDLKQPKLIYCYQQLGKISSVQKNQDKALYNFKKAIEALHKYEMTRSGIASDVYLSVGDHYALTGQYDSALVNYRKAIFACVSSTYNAQRPLADVTQVKLRYHAYRASLKMASSYAMLYEQKQTPDLFEKGMTSFEMAESLFELTRADLNSDNSKWMYSDSNFELYDQALTFAMHSDNPNNRIGSVLYFMEKSKAKTLMDALQNARFENTSIRNDSTVMQLSNLRGRIHYLQDKSDEAQQKNDTKQVTQFRNDIITADREMKRLEADLRQRYPSYYSQQSDFSSNTSDKIKNYARKKELCIIEYFWGGKELFGLAISGDQIIVKSLGKISTIEKLIDLNYSFLSSTDYKGANEAKTFMKNSNELHDLILLPFKEVYGKTDRIVIIPDGKLSVIPFETLTTEKSANPTFASLNYLIKEHTLSYSFSINWLMLRERSSLGVDKVLGFGFSDKSLRNQEKNRAELMDIRGTKDELIDLEEKFPNGSFYIGKEATEEKFKQQAAAADIIHIATHGQSDVDDKYSAMLFFNGHEKTEDGILNWYELVGMKLKAKLTVITSCESGLGKEYRGEGILSMATAFTLAGCRNVVMGLWKVNDDVSVKLMDSFYVNIKEGQSSEIALANAKRAYLESADDLTADPRLWNSLVIYGDDQIMRDNTVWIIGSLFSLVLAVGLYFYKKKKADIQLVR